MKWEEQGTSWSLQLKEDIRGIQEDGSGAPVSPSQADDDDEDRDWLPSIGLKAEPMSPSQSDDGDDAADCKEEWNEEGGARLPSNRLEAESAPERHTAEKRESGCLTVGSEDSVCAAGRLQENTGAAWPYNTQDNTDRRETPQLV
ncbi:unnamed protein product [Coregonus sp. 'balchen']|nr:unnamed protein product [Coregonus sp. 'balchen']